MTGLTAPQHLKGPMAPGTELAAERNAWAAEMAKAGHSSPAIAKALGICQENALRAARRGGWRHEPKAPSADAVRRKWGVSIGNTGAALATIPPTDQDRIFAEAAKRGQTIAEALVQHFLEAGR